MTCSSAWNANMNLFVVKSAMTATAGEINPISEWFAMIVCPACVENLIEYHSYLGMA